MEVSGQLCALAALTLVPTEYDLSLFSSALSGQDYVFPPLFCLNYSEATERSFMDCDDDSAQGFSPSAYRYVPLKLSLALVTQPKALFCCQAYGMVITTNIHVNKMARHLEGSKGRISRGKHNSLRKMWGSKLMRLFSVTLYIVCNPCISFDYLIIISVHIVLLDERGFLILLLPEFSVGKVFCVHECNIVELYERMMVKLWHLLNLGCR
jgi:hypothetical protein